VQSVRAKRMSIQAIPALASDAGRVSGVVRRKNTRQPKADFEIPIVQIAYTPINTKYAVEIPATIPSDGKEYAVQIDRFTLDADYRYTTVPKLDKQAYLSARIIGWEKHNFRNGSMNVYFEDAFVGKSAMDLSYVEDTLALSLGADPSIVVDRRRVDAKSQRQILGTNRTDSRAWSISVKNLKSTPIRIRVEDQVPVALNENIAVDVQLNKNGAHDTDTGIVSWELEINATKSEDISLKYSVKRPRDFHLSLE